ncbi:siderophore-iron reductase FhuF [Acerihabitans sp. TG2]|uniref:siderophore-iron reductase FhuF n=1 Tax=Acerihabitans sp. TG2 TaxID=3096008 RepID=UPI002B2390A8|nr:siderophore-iron reductase FhuF [Acerihabitans sp. TG2]MEA9390262.1 siderophore-iron reductase FhuF [Acerihabitans sp. TG2]
MLKLFEMHTDPRFYPLLNGIVLLEEAKATCVQLLPATQLTDPYFIGRQLGFFARQRGWQQQDISAVASMWSKSYLSLFTGGWLIARVLLDKEIVAHPARLLLAHNEAGLVTSVVVPNQGKNAAPVSSVNDFTPLFRQHITPHFTSLSEVAGVNVAVLWSNVASGVDTLFRLLSASGQLSPEKQEAMSRLFTEKYWPDGERNLLYRPVFTRKSPTGETIRLRKGCCLRYLLPEMGYCKNCCLPQAWQANFPTATTDS